MKVFDDIQFVLRDSTGRDVTDHLIKVSDNELKIIVENKEKLYIALRK